MSTSARRARAAALVLVGALALAGCGGSDDDPGAGPSSSSGAPAPPTETVAPTATEPDAPPPPTVSRPTAFTATAADAAAELKAAWEAGDRDRAATIAPGDVVAALFPIPADGFEVYGCDSGEFDTSTCNFRNRGTGVYITVNSEKLDRGWQVASIYVDEG